MNDDTIKEEERFREETLSFRFVNLSGKATEELRKVWRGKLETKPFRDTGNFVVWFDLREGIDYTALIEFVARQRLPTISYGLYCSVVTEYSVDGIRVPSFAAELFHQTGGTIDFSCTKV